MKESNILEQYNVGNRCFQKVDLRGHIFKGKNFSGADFSYAKLNQTSFLGCQLDYVKFVGAETGQHYSIKIIFLAFAIIAAFVSGILAVIVSIGDLSISIISTCLLLLPLILFIFIRPSSRKIVISTIIIIVFLIFLFFWLEGLTLDKKNDGLNLIISFFLFASSVVFGMISSCLFRVNSSFLKFNFLKNIIYNDVISGIFLCGVFTIISATTIILIGPNKVGITNNIIFACVNIVSYSLLIYLSYKKAPYDSIMVSTLAKMFAIENTSFKGSSLIGADFSRTRLAGVDFRGTNMSGACLFNSMGTDLVLADRQLSLNGMESLQHWPKWMDEVLNPASETQSRIDVGIIIALEEEFRQFAQQISARSHFDQSNNQYYYLFEKKIPNSTYSYKCVVTFMGSMGTTNSGIGGERLIRSFNPITVVSIGIAGSMDSDVFVGDVLVADQTDEYLSSSKVIETINGQWEFKLSGDPFKTDPTYISHVKNLKYSNPQLFKNWEKQSILLDYVDAESVKALREYKLVNDGITIHTGHIASGPSVIATDVFVEWLKKNRDRKFLAIEMESAGIVNAAFSRNVRSLIIRGISDYSDKRKEKLDQIGGGGLRLYAMNNAIALLWFLMDLKLISHQPPSISEI